jgi:hypothetical protein
VLRLSRPVEFALVEEQIQEIDELVEQGQTSLSWNSMGTHFTTYFVPKLTATVENVSLYFALSLYFLRC